MDYSQSRRRIIEVDFSYMDDFLDMYNECRCKWPIYFPPVDVAALENIVACMNPRCLYAVEQDEVILGYLIGYIHSYFSADLVRVAHHETIMVSPKRCKSGITIYKVTEMLVDALIKWAHNEQAQRIVWSTGTGYGRALEHMLYKRNATQIGVVLNMEV